MSKYKVGDKVVLTVSDVNEKAYYPYYMFNNNNSNLWISNTDDYAEPLSTYTEPLEDTIQKHTVKIARLVMEKEGLKDENERLKAENKKMSAKIDAYELYGGQHEEEYNKAFNQGAEAAWELARKITYQPINGGFKRSEFEEIFGDSYISDIFKKYTYQEAAAKIAEWEKAKEEIKVGDVLENIYISKVKCVVTNLYPDNMAYSIFGDGIAGMHEIYTFKKTGRHIDIDNFLKQIRGEQE